MLFIHAILGCDTTSSVFGIGKGLALKKIKLPHFTKQAEVFRQPNRSKDEIASAGEAALVCIYGGLQDEELNHLRYKRFLTKVATGSVYVEPKSLPPTSEAARYHSFRVYHQVQRWMGADLDACDWCWEAKDGMLIPVKTHKEPAPQSLLKVIHCNCKTDCCTRKCTCKRHGLECSDVCGECRGVSCTNTSYPDQDSDDNEQ